MIRPGKNSTFTILLALLLGALNAPAATNALPDFKEVYEAIRAHVAGVDDAELNRAAVAGLLKELGPKASLVARPEDSSATGVTQLVSKVLVFEDSIAYLRIARMADGLAAALRAAYTPLSESNKLKGVVVDLRFAEGADYPSVMAVAELFSLKNPATLDWGKGSQESKTGNGPVTPPVILLVNSGTRGAAEALAALLRETGAGLILGNHTAGQALLTKDFPLSEGAILRVATAAVKLNGVELVPVRPDIDVAVSTKEEQAFFADAFLVPAKANLAVITNKLSGTNASGRRVRLTEAELVRAHKQGLNPAEDEEGFIAGTRETKPEAPLVSDPALTRALDLLKGLAIVRPAHP